MFRFVGAAKKGHSRKFLVAAGATTAASGAGILFLLNKEHYHRNNTTLLQDNNNDDENTSQLIRKYTSKPLPTREFQLEKLQSFATRENPLDVLVVGGGCTGSGTALDAATRGLNTALLERHDFGSETSSRSTKLIWAGTL